MPAEVVEVHGERRVRRSAGVDGALVEAVLAAPALRTMHENRRGSVVEVAVGPDRFARKEYRPPRLARFRSSPARRSWRTLLEGSERALPLPAPVCLVEQRDGTTTLVTRWCDGDHIHLVHAGERAGRLAAPAERRRFAAAIAGTVATLLEAGVRTADLAPQNILVHHDGDRWTAVLVDLDDVRFVDRVPPSHVLENLAQLGHLPPTVPATDRLRGLRSFLECGGRAVLAAWLARHGERALVRELGRRIARLEREKRDRLERKGAADHPYAGWGLREDGSPVR